MAVAFDAVGPSSAGAARLDYAADLDPRQRRGCHPSAVRARVLDQHHPRGGGLATTYNSVTMGSAVQTWQSGGSLQTVGYAVIYSMASPPTGSHTAGGTWTGGDNLCGGSVSFTGSATLGTPVHADSNGVAVTSGSISLAGTTAGNQVFCVVVAGSGGIAFSTGTQR